ncbi:MAG: SGNH/GDSL hydrolase family protein [Planctomycetes bacterium]|nr:SGNH/GDSL hydrolase family protein [Planctomycetota bacterium]MCB9870356.1 SGNH/GDSL hydrolase family protein [Planctomycetota bacterium]
MSATPASPPKQGTARRGWRVRLTLLASAVLGTVLGAEVVLWAVDAYPPMPRSYPGDHGNREHPTFVADAVLGWRTRPNLDIVLHGEGGAVPVLADASGRRTGRGRAKSATRPHRVLLGGDSFIWGAGVAFEDSLAARLERRFPTLHVENVAQPGYGLDQAVLAIEHAGLQPAPALVVLGIYPNNLGRSLTAYRADLGINKPTFRLDGGDLVQLTPDDRPTALFRWCETHSRVWGLWRRAQRRVGFEHGVGPWWKVNEALLERLRTRIAAAGSRLVLVHVPLHAWRSFGGLVEYAKRHGVPLVDPVQMDRQKPAGLYFEPAGHLTPKGHEYLADKVVAWIERSGLGF